jgi:hypothetical protein
MKTLAKWSVDDYHRMIQAASSRSIQGSIMPLAFDQVAVSVKRLLAQTSG